MLNLSTQWDFRWVNISTAIVSGSNHSPIASVCVCVFNVALVETTDNIHLHNNTISGIGIWDENDHRQQKRTSASLSLSHLKNSLVCRKLMLYFVLSASSTQAAILKLKQCMNSVYCFPIHVAAWIWKCISSPNKKKTFSYINQSLCVSEIWVHVYLVFSMCVHCDIVIFLLHIFIFYVYLIFCIVSVWSYLSYLQQNGKAKTATARMHTYMFMCVTNKYENTP